jgi:elongation factor Ts
MTSISANDVKELRERTGAGMMECKKALVDVGGDIEAAIEAMRKSGIAKAAKKAGRVAAEGLIDIKIHAGGESAIMLEVNCETDFVGRDANFKTFVQSAAETALATNIDDVAKLSKTVLAGQSKTVEEARQELISKMGENIQIRRIAVMSCSGTIGAYVHGGRIGTLVALSAKNPDLVKDLAMHIAASSPQYIKPEDVPPEIIEREKEIFIAQSADSGKPIEIIEKMVKGRIHKFVNEISLIGQPFVKDPNQTIGQLLKAANAQVMQFIRFEVGEGIEKTTEDFAAAVMAQIGAQ